MFELNTIKSLLKFRPRTDTNYLDTRKKSESHCYYRGLICFVLVVSTLAELTQSVGIKEGFQGKKIAAADRSPAINALIDRSGTEFSQRTQLR